MLVDRIEPRNKVRCEEEYEKIGDCFAGMDRGENYPQAVKTYKRHAAGAHSQILFCRSLCKR